MDEFPKVIHTESDPSKRIEIEQNAKAIAERFSKEGFAVIEELLKEAKEAKLASRWNTDPESSTRQYKDRIGLPEGGIIRPTKKLSLNEEGEAGMKRQGLINDLTSIKTKLINLAGELEERVKDLKTCQIE